MYKRQVGIVAISSSLTPFIGQNLGANKLDRIRIAINYSFVLSGVWGILIALPLLIFSNDFSNLFSYNAAVQNIFD